MTDKKDSVYNRDLDEAMIAEMRELARSGLAFENIAHKMRLSSAYIRDLRKRGKKAHKQTLSRRAFDALNEGRADFLERVHAKVVAQADKDWKAAAWLLERRDMKNNNDRHLQSEDLLDIDRSADYETQAKQILKEADEHNITRHEAQKEIANLLSVADITSLTKIKPMLDELIDKVEK